jgi:hypothetical protein
MSNALEDLKDYLDADEAVESIVFGPWGWGSGPDKDGVWEKGYSEPDEVPVPLDKRGVVLTLDEAAPYMQSWSFHGGFGAPECYAVRVWTNKRVIWVTQYDGATSLDSAPRNPVACIPDMPGG